MSVNLLGLISSPERRHAQQLAYSVEMVGDIASSYDGALDRHEYAFARCMLDAFYVHVRLLADFLVTRTDRKDFGPADFGVEWVAPDTAGSARLSQHWDVASKYVVHFGRPRVPETLEDLAAFQIGGKHFRDMARDALDVFSEFLEELEAKTPGWEGGTRLPDRDTEPIEWQARNLSDRTKMLRDSYMTARRKVGGAALDT
jgi:hypothetical protein